MQLRTTLQDAWANQVEDTGHTTGIGFKFGRGPSEVNSYYRLVSRAFAAVEQDQGFRQTWPLSCSRPIANRRILPDAA